MAMKEADAYDPRADLLRELDQYKGSVPLSKLKTLARLVEIASPVLAHTVRNAAKDGLLRIEKDEVWLTGLGRKVAQTVK